jgi:outer membrane protein insertion porin family
MPRSIVFLCASLCATPLFAQTPPCESQEEPCEPATVQEPSEEPPAEPTLSLPDKDPKKLSGTFQVGAGYASEEGFIANAQIAQNNFLGKGYQLSMDASVSSRRQELFLHFKAPHLGEKDGTFAFDTGTALYLFPNNIEKEWTGGRVSWGRELADNWSMTLIGTIADTTLSSPLQFFPSDLLAGGLSTMGSVRFAYNVADNPNNPRNTFQQSFQLDVSKNLENESSFVRVQKDVSYSFAFRQGELASKGPVLRIGAKLGYMTSMNPDEEIPVSDRFFVGGDDSVRGFAPGVLGPKFKVIGGPDQASSTISIGGTSKAVFNSQLEFGLVPRVGLRGFIFFDAGNSFGGLIGKDSGLFLSPEKDFGVIPLRTAAGVGLRWESPIGPLNFTFGMPLDRRPGEAPVLFTFSIGRNF